MAPRNNRVDYDASLSPHPCCYPIVEHLEPRLLLSAATEAIVAIDVPLVGDTGLADTMVPASQLQYAPNEGVLVASSLDAVGPSVSGEGSVSGRNETNVIIPDVGDWVRSSIEITGAPAGSVITSVDVYVEILHPYVSDLRVDLDTDPVTTTWTIHNYAGLPGQNIMGWFYNDTDFDGMSPNQKWDLWAIDSAYLDQGGILDWTIVLHYAVDDDRFEPNNTPAAAKNLGDRTSQFTESSLIGGTDDWYKFTTLGPGGATDDVTITFNHAQGDLDLVVFESDATTVWDSSESDTNNETVSLNGAPAGTYYVLVSPVGGAFNPNYSLTIDPPLPNLPPKVADVLVSSTSWDAGFLAALGGRGFSIPTGPDQLATLPWTNIDQVKIVFSEDVNVSQGDLSIHGVNVPDYAIVGFNYDGGSLMASWILSGAGAADKLLLTLSDDVTDVVGDRLDGEWSDGVSAFPSGNGSKGGDFQFRLNVLPGDTDGDLVVGSGDLGTLASQFGLRGSSLAADVNGDGWGDLGDFAILRRNFGNTLPAAEPAAALQAAAESITAAAAPVVPVVSQRLDENDANDDSIAIIASAPAIDLLVESPSAAGCISGPQAISGGSSATMLQRAATSAYDLRPMGGDLVTGEGDDLLADILAESALALPL